MHRLSQLLPFLEEQKIRAKRSLSQNFLVDGNIVQKILATAQIAPGDLVLEIGPGPGALTEALLAHDVEVIAVEKDRQLAHALERFNSPRLKVLQEDILECDLHSLAPQGRQIKVISNLPYHLTSPILAKLLPESALFSSLTLMMQKEVAKRVVAKAHTAEYGSLTLFCRFYALLNYAFTVSANCFYPAPKVNSAVVHFQTRLPLETIDPTLFFKLTRRAFQQRRKMLRASLKELYPSELIEQWLTQIDQKSTARPEELSLEAWQQFYDLLAPSSSP